MARKGINNRLAPFVAMPWSMMNHNAFKKLPPTPAKMLPYFLGKVQLPGNDKNPAYYKTTFEFTYSEAFGLGCAKRTFGKVIEKLMEFGFIDPVKKGGLRGAGLTSSIFRLSARCVNYHCKLVRYFHEN